MRITANSRENAKAKVGCGLDRKSFEAQEKCELEFLRSKNPRREYIRTYNECRRSFFTVNFSVLALFYFATIIKSFEAQSELETSTSTMYCTVAKHKLKHVRKKLRIKGVLLKTRGLCMMLRCYSTSTVPIL